MPLAFPKWCPDTITGIPWLPAAIDAVCLHMENGHTTKRNLKTRKIRRVKNINIYFATAAQISWGALYIWFLQRVCQVEASIVNWLNPNTFSRMFLFQTVKSYTGMVKQEITCVHDEIEAASIMIYQAPPPSMLVVNVVCPYAKGKKIKDTRID